MTSLAALLAAPALPAKALAATAMANSVAPPNLYTWSAMLARTHGTCSADTLARALNIDTSRASGLVDRLIANKVISAPNAIGVSEAKNMLKPEPTDVFDALEETCDETPKTQDGESVLDTS